MAPPVRLNSQRPSIFLDVIDVPPSCVCNNLCRVFLSDQEDFEVAEEFHKSVPFLIFFFFFTVGRRTNQISGADHTAASTGPASTSFLFLSLLRSGCSNRHLLITIYPGTSIDCNISPSSLLFFGLRWIICPNTRGAALCKSHLTEVT